MKGLATTSPNVSGLEEVRRSWTGVRDRGSVYGVRCGRTPQHICQANRELVRITGSRNKGALRQQGYDPFLPPRNCTVIRPNANGKSLRRRCAVD